MLCLLHQKLGTLFPLSFQQLFQTLWGIAASRRLHCTAQNWTERRSLRLTGLIAMLQSEKGRWKQVQKHLQQRPHIHYSIVCRGMSVQSMWRHSLSPQHCYTRYAPPSPYTVDRTSFGPYCWPDSIGCPTCGWHERPHSSGTFWILSHRWWSCCCYCYCSHAVCCRAADWSPMLVNWAVIPWYRAFVMASHMNSIVPQM